MRNGRVVVMREVVLGDLVGRRLPYMVMGQDVVQDFGEILDAMGTPHHVRVECDAHEAPARFAFAIELIELRLADLRVVIAVVVMAEERCIVQLRGIRNAHEAA